MFTKPPAVESLSTDTLGLVGVVTVISICALGAKLFKPEIKELPKERSLGPKKE